jgi:hypothetical protein
LGAIGVGAVPGVPLPEILLLVKDWVAPVMPVPLKATSVLEITVVPALASMPMPPLLLTTLCQHSLVRRPPRSRSWCSRKQPSD